MSNGATGKLTKNIGFRPGAEFRQEIEALAAASRGNWNISDIARVGLLTFWPQIKAIVQSTTTPPQDEASLAEIRESLDLLRTAQAQGLDLRATLTAALNAKAEAEAA